MTTAGWIVVGVLLLAAIAIVVLWWRSDRRARVEASRHTEDEVKGWSAAALERERARSDEEAAREFDRRFGDE